MSEFKYKSITTKGMELLAQAINGQKLEFTRIEMGSGTFEGDIGSAESLVEARQNLPITKITRKGSQVSLSTVLKIEDITSSYNWTEIGVYARGEDGVEVLYMYGHTTNSSFISMDSLNEKLINITVLVANTTQVTAIIDDSLVYLTAEALKNHENDHTTHQDIRESVEGVKQQLGQLDISWEGIKDKPQQFNPAQHRHNASEIDNLPSSLPANGGNADTVGGVGISAIYHTSNKPTKTDVGLSNVPNYPATTAINDSSTSKLATASAVKQAYDKAEQAFQSASNGKNQIATAITGKGVGASGNDSFGVLSSKINQIKVTKKIKSHDNNISAYNFQIRVKETKSHKVSAGYKATISSLILTNMTDAQVVIKCNEPVAYVNADWEERVDIAQPGSEVRLFSNRSYDAMAVFMNGGTFEVVRGEATLVEYFPFE